MLKHNFPAQCGPAAARRLCLGGWGSSGGGGSSSRLEGLLLESVLLERTHKGQLVGGGLEATMSHLGRGVNELEVDLLQRRPAGVDEQGLAQSEDALLAANAAALQHQEVVVDLTIMGETTHGGDGLVRQIVFGGGVVLDELRERKESKVNDMWIGWKIEANKGEAIFSVLSFRLSCLYQTKKKAQ